MWMWPRTIGSTVGLRRMITLDRLRAMNNNLHGWLLYIRHLISITNSFHCNKSTWVTLGLKKDCNFLSKELLLLIIKENVKNVEMSFAYLNEHT